jgi:hypothetical protein
VVQQQLRCRCCRCWPSRGATLLLRRRRRGARWPGGELLWLLRAGCVEWLLLSAALPVVCSKGVTHGRQRHSVCCGGRGAPSCCLCVCGSWCGHHPAAACLRINEHSTHISNTRTTNEGVAALLTLVACARGAPTSALLLLLLAVCREAARCAYRRWCWPDLRQLRVEELSIDLGAGPRWVGGGDRAVVLLLWVGGRGGVQVEGREAGRTI